MATTRLLAQIRRRVSSCALAVFASGSALAQALPELDPTQFQVAAQEDAARGIKAGIGLDAFDRRRTGADAAELGIRSIFDFRNEWRFGSGWSATLSDRIEWVEDDGGTSTVRNALREGYVTRRLNDALFADLGRINLRSGVASGFNPTDWLREGAALPQTSQNPASLRENRLGTFMMRFQAIEDWGAAHVAAIPHLARKRDEISRYGFAWGSTNDDQALHARVAPKLSEDVSLDLLAYAREGRRPQWGLNLTSVLNHALIAHVELAAGKRTGLNGPGAAPSIESHQRAAAGFSWAAPNGAVVSVERHIATDALSRRDWEAWRQAADGPTVRGLAQLRAQRSGLQEPLVRDAWFVRTAITGLTDSANLDLAAFVRINPYDRSYLWQIDGGWHLLPRASIYASLGGFAGSSRSEFGANPMRGFLSVRLEMAY